MMSLPDQFDLLVRKAKSCHDSLRQIDYLLGTMVGLPSWYFYQPDQLAEVSWEGMRLLLVFTSLSKAEDLTEEFGLRKVHDPLPVVTVPMEKAIMWCLELQPRGLNGLMVNPGTYGFIITLEQLAHFYKEWKENGGRDRQGFWIPNMTDEEEDFWQEHGL